MNKLHTCSFRCLIWIYVATACVVIFIFQVYKYRSGEVNYVNSDATWHVLLTVQAYNETPISIHKFLPIVNFGGVDDKNIPWGTALPDENGNYYYTSFSSAGFILAWAFIKMLNLPVSEQSLYLLNSILFAISVSSWLLFIGLFYKKNQNRNTILFIAMLSVIFVPEIMHGMGIVYWHHSILQATFPLQVLSFYIWKTNESKCARLLFYLFVLINPLIEWSGYVINLSFIIYMYTKNKSHLSPSHRRSILLIACLTCASFALLCIHQFLVVSPVSYFNTLYNRFVARSLNGETIRLGIQDADLFSCYIRSFWAWWAVIAILFVWTLIRRGKVELQHKYELLLFLLLIVENVVMLEHAKRYSFDRMKMVFFLSFVICELLVQLFDVESASNKTRVVIFAVVLFCSGANLYRYCYTDEYVWMINYRKNNQIFAKYLLEKYSDSVLGTNVLARGYINLLFHRGIYDNTEMMFVKNKVKHENKRYGIMLYFEGDTEWHLYHLTLDTSSVTWRMMKLVRAVIYDSLKQKTYSLSISKEGVVFPLPENNCHE